MAGIGTAGVPAASGTSYRAPVPSGVSPGIDMVLEMRDGDKSKLRTRVSCRPWSTSSTSSNKLLGMDVWEQAEIEHRLVESLDGTKNEWCWSGANSSANATLAISKTVCRASAAKNEVFLYTYISKLTDKPSDKSMMPALPLNIFSGGSHAGNCLACPEFLIVPTEASNVAEDMITNTEVPHTLKFCHQEDVRRDACNVGETDIALSVQLTNESLDFFTASLELDQGVLPRHE